ncbi:MAG: phosphoenolpyruvate--protein phosphotransferase, partial [Bdellovibrionota bacterium]
MSGVRTRSLGIGMPDEISDSSTKLRILEEIASLISRSHELQDTLDQICKLVTKNMAFDVCSIYLLGDEGDTLILRATHGLDPASVGKVTMRVHEGITGLAIEERRPVAVENAPEHPRYKYFPETHEEEFLSLMATPIIEKGIPIGVLNVQTRETRDFNQDDLSVLMTIATQVAVIVENYRLLQAVSRHEVPLPAALERERKAGEEEKRGSSIVRGIGASPGISIGRAVVVDPGDLASIFEAKEHVDDPRKEAEAFEEALVQVREQIKEAERRIAERLSDEEAKIFSTHLMILEDEGFLGRIREELVLGRSALFAVRDVVAQYVRLFEGIKDPYIREKISDIEDIGKRLLNVLSRRDSPFAGRKHIKGILVAPVITPSEAMELEANDFIGLVTSKGGANSHASILARSFEIPAVVGIEQQIRSIRDGDQIVVDGVTGNVYVNPSPTVLKEFRRAKRDYEAVRHEIEEGAHGRAVTKDGTRIHLMANVGILADARTASNYQAEGIGLYRTEFVYLARPAFPTEDEQVKAYSAIIRQMRGQRVVIRTLDLGGDKFLPYLDHQGEDNPYLGWRSIRVSLDLVHVFKSQLRAILRSSVEGKVGVMFPMITTPEELLRAKEVLDEARRELEEQKIAFDAKIPIGMMVEVPSAALMAEQFIGDVEFFSIGTNDLTQYTLAVDRNNQRVAALYDPLHPAVLRLIDHTVEVATKAGKDVTVCGELSGVPEAVPLLVGLGCRSLSMSP